ncbi:MAG: T9SS C-terminal target domain-containing protein, partial [Bacteroidetes bacterium]
LYALDTTGHIRQTCPVPGTTNRDWEAVASDGSYLYLGDFGNNANGGRQDLRILRIAHLCTDSVQVDTIAFTYAGADSLIPGPANQTDYDCEALVATSDSLYLFAKQWQSQGTRTYALPKQPGSWTAQLRDSLAEPGLITGASLLDSARVLMLCGYSTTLQPFLLLCYDYPERRFFQGNIRRLKLGLSFHQIEAIDSPDGLTAYLTNERFSNVITTPAKLHRLDLQPFLGTYLLGPASTLAAAPINRFRLYPNPAGEAVTLDLSGGPDQPYALIDSQGRQIRQGQIRKGSQALPLQDLSTGTYYLITPTQKELLQIQK